MTFRNPHSLFMTPCTLITITSLAWSPINLPPTCCSLGREVLPLNPKTVLSGDKTPKCSLVHGPSEQVIYLIQLLLAAATHAVNLFFATSVMSFYHMNLEVIADICFGARESVVKSWLPLLRSWTCQCVFFRISSFEKQVYWRLHFRSIWRVEEANVPYIVCSCAVREQQPSCVASPESPSCWTAREKVGYSKHGGLLPRSISGLGVCVF